MATPRDPIQERAGESHDLYEIATWEPRTFVDSLSVGIYRIGMGILRAVVVLLALVILLGQVVLGGFGILADPVAGTLVLLSVVPALAIAGYIWYIDVTEREPLSLLVATFVLGVLFAMFAAVINAMGVVPFTAAGALLEAVTPAEEATASLIVLTLFFFLVVGPIEEAVKLLAIRLHAYRSPRFDAVINGAVYGAAAGLGFATIENALYIARGLEPGLEGLELIGPGGEVAIGRALAGPGHVLYSSIAGFYLGLAKFNPDRAGPLVVKGILIAAVFHALYNTLVSVVPPVLAGVVEPLTRSAAFLGFVFVYFAIVGVFLLRKIEGYRRTYRDVGL